MATDEDLFKTIGGFGRYQKLQLLIISLYSFFGVELLFCNFLMYTPEHWCKVENLNGWNNLSLSDVRNLTIPWDEESQTFSSCEMYELPNQNESSNSYDNTSVTKCQSWNFDDSEYSNTVVTRWQLVCEKAWLVDLVPTCQVLGYLVGSYISGWTSDRYGRWKATVIFTAVKLLSCLLSMFTPSFILLVIARFILGIGTMAGYLASYVLVLETTSPVHRTWMGVNASLMFSFGSMFLAGLAYIERDWRRIQMASTVPCFILLIAITFCLHESPRWLLLMAQKEKGLKILRKIGKMNKKPYFENVPTSEEKTDPVPSEKSESKTQLSKLFSTPAMRKYSFICIITWCTVSLIFYALSLNARALSGNLFINFFLLSAVEVPANLAGYACLRSRLLGRRRTHILAYLQAGLACFISVPLIIVYGNSYITTGLAIVGKAGATTAFTGIYIYTAELFPTEIRTLALGVSSLSARVGGIMASYAGGSLGKVWAPLPSLIFGITGTIAGLLIILLPETRGRVLKDTVDEEEKEMIASKLTTANTPQMLNEVE